MTGGFDVDPYEYICSKPCVLRTEEGYVMWVNTYGTTYRVPRLVRRDGLTWPWTKRLGPEGELGVGVKGSFDDEQRSYPCVVAPANMFHCWYTGNAFGRTRTGYTSDSTDLCASMSMRRRPMSPVEETGSTWPTRISTRWTN